MNSWELRRHGENTVVKFYYSSGQEKKKIQYYWDLCVMWVRLLVGEPWEVFLGEGSLDKIMKKNGKLIQAIICISNLNIM